MAELPPTSIRKTFLTSINLLPPEMLLKQKQSSKLVFINKLSIFALIALIFFTSIALSFRLTQNFELQKAQKGLVDAKEKISSLKGKEEQILLLKERLGIIQTLSGGDAKIRAIFNLVVHLIPSDLQISEVSVDKTGNMSLSLNSSSLVSLQNFLTDLADREKNSDLIAKVTLEGLSIGKDMVYRLSLKIVLKDGLK